MSEAKTEEAVAASPVIDTATPPSNPNTPKPSDTATLPTHTLPAPSASATPASPAETIRPADADAPASGSSAAPALAQTNLQRALEHGLNRANLEEEVGQVMGSFNSWWGGVKKQSVSALSSIKADLDKTVTQAQADLEYLRTAKVEIVRKDTDGSSTTEAANQVAEANADIKGKGKEREVDEVKPTAKLLDRLTTSTSQLQQTLQSTFQSTIASAANNPALSNPAQLRTQLAENLRLSSAKENLQLSMKQAEKMAEDYLRKGDQWVKDAEKWMGDAVKVLPPDEETRYISTSWDGSDFYAFSTSSPVGAGEKDGVVFDADARRGTAAPAVLAASRKDALLTRLREDKDLLLVDPAGEGETDERKGEFKKWVEVSWETESKAGKEQEIGNVGAIRMALVPEHLTDDQFWQRYLFHKHMIEAEETKRRKLLEATQHSQADDFSWDDEPEESPSAVSTKVEKPVEVVKEKAPSPQKPKAEPIPSAGTSPRDSEESYDLVSDQGVKPAKTAAPAADDDEDSDWE